MGAWKVGEEVLHVYAVMTNSNAMRRFDAIFCGVCDAENGNVTIYFCEFKTFKWTETTLCGSFLYFFLMISSGTKLFISKNARSAPLKYILSHKPYSDFVIK